MQRFKTGAKNSRPYTKAFELARWEGLDASKLPLAESMPVIPYKSRGSSYGAGGVRIDGPPEFVDAVLARLKDLLDLEGIGTRLELSRSKVKQGVEINGKVKSFEKAGADAEVCYIRAHKRGAEGAMSACFDPANRSML